MATMNVKDSAGSTVAVEKPLAPGRAAAASSRPVALSTEDKSSLDAVKTATEAVSALVSGGKLEVHAAIDPSTVNANGRSLPANSAPVVEASQDYQDIAASQTDVAVVGQNGSTGAAGDWLDFILVIPETTSPGSVTLQDGANTQVTIFVGGASSVGSLVPFVIPVKAVSDNGAWKIDTGANVHVRAVGNFT